MLPAQYRQLHVLVAGSHADDIELGAGGLVQRLVERGHTVSFLVLTDEHGFGNVRRAEAGQAARRLGVPEGNLLFAGFSDGNLRADRQSVGHVRKLLGEAGIYPEVVVTHSAADSHNDHVQANALLRAACRRQVLLFYPIHTSAEPSRFRPRLFVSLSGCLGEVKMHALDEHRSQLSRLTRCDQAAFEEQLGRLAGLDRAEAFEIDFQVGTGDALLEVMALNDSAFHRLWQPLIRDESLFLLYGIHPQRPRSGDRCFPHYENAGRDYLREAFADLWFPRSPLRERPATVEDVEPVVEKEHLVLVGGPLGNPVTRRLINRNPTVDWLVDSDTQHSSGACLVQRSTGRRIRPKRDRLGRLVEDVGLLTIMPSDSGRGKSVVACAGGHGVGTQALLQFLARPQANPTLAGRTTGRTAVQVPVRIDIDTFQITPLAQQPQTLSNDARKVRGSYEAAV
ncbi:MAG TPA: PIG-L deacetylase family protein [Micromonosporaceae bacterium]|nr:PIG-L deacetylase family protein [Micromonosporaceae bacterium]